MKTKKNGVWRYDYESQKLDWIYGSIAEDILTGFKMHCRGWRSVHCMPKRPAFKGSSPINLPNRLNKVFSSWETSNTYAQLLHERKALQRSKKGVHPRTTV